MVVIVVILIQSMEKMRVLITLITNNYRSIDSLCYRAVSIIWLDRGEYYSFPLPPSTHIIEIMRCI
jgi:hypothetical protein